MNDSSDCIVCGTCVADMLVRPVPLDTAVGGGRLFYVDPIAATVGGIVCKGRRWPLRRSWATISGET
jgi:hypothetical protein